MKQYPDEFKLSWTHYNGVEDKDHPDLVQYVEDVNYFKSRLKDGNLYIKFIDGDRKGSIARLEPNPKYKDSVCEYRGTYNTWLGKSLYRPVSDIIFAVCRWDKRSNKVQFDSHWKNFVFLPNYTGPTVWELFDKNAAKQKLMEELEVFDIDDNELKVGDRVLYINLRYGAGGMLDHGKIKEFKIINDSKTYRVETIIERDGDGVLSTVNYPENMVYKKV